MPELLDKYLDDLTRIYGDFDVCPFTDSRPGEMQDVCIAAVRNVVIEKLDRKTMKRQVYRLPGTFRCCAD